MTTLPPGSVIEDKAAVWLHQAWRLARTAPGACAHPDALDGLAAQWHDARVPGTVASSIHPALDVPGPYDADDWWYRTQFAAPAGSAGKRVHLRFDGLATLAEVWLNGEKILDSRNMFVAHRIEVTGRLRGENRLALCFRSLTAAAARRHPRPRWKTALVKEQNLRWFRTTLLGRIPGWTPPIEPVGPWRAVALEIGDETSLETLRLHAAARGSVGHVSLRAQFGGAVEEAHLLLGEAAHSLRVEGSQALGDIEVADAPLWWPHTHGTPHLVACRLEAKVAGQWRSIDCGPIGFKEIAVEGGDPLVGDGAVRFVVNGVPVFCRGACWTTGDIVSLASDPATLCEALTRARDAGVNMLRVGGTMACESESFYRLCDELGILVWQDFMFANMDYPVGESVFRAEIEAEARHLMERLRAHACIAVYCGGSEVAQQAAMMGLARAHWTNDFFAQWLPAACAAHHPGIPYFPSSPWGGALPFHVSTGLAHYYGVGAYRRPLADVKTARVKFAPECLGFSQVPEPATAALVGDGTVPAPHDPRWKARVPRDSGAGYDFEDVRDHYLRELFGVDPFELRARDAERYYALSRVVTGELMGRVFSEWRRAGSECGGALVWFYRDLWPGAGWGITDSRGIPKAAYWYLKRAWAPRTVRITDEGLDGVALHVLNEDAEPLVAEVELELLRDGRLAFAPARSAVRVPARGAITLQGDALLGYFSDANNAYRFGPPKADVIVARLRTGETVLAEDFHFPLGLALPVRAAAVRCEARELEGGDIALRLHSDAFLQAVRVTAEGFDPDDNYFHVSPTTPRALRLRRRERDRPFQARIEALNLGAAHEAR